MKQVLKKVGHLDAYFSNIQFFLMRYLVDFITYTLGLFNEVKNVFSKSLINKIRTFLFIPHTHRMDITKYVEKKDKNV